jgi:hypothetical protein
VSPIGLYLTSRPGYSGSRSGYTALLVSLLFLT